MKKLISFVLAFVLLVSVAITPVFAGENYNKSDKEYLFENLIPDKVFAYFYDEVYYHYVDDKLDWALIYCDTYQGSPSGTVRVVLDRVIVTGVLGAYYPVCWAIYDAQLNEFISIDKIDATKYDGLEQALIDNKVGNPFGDADLDGEVTVLDATYIQRALAGLCEFKEYDLIQGTPWGVEYDRPLEYISDIDADGERTVLDATAIQLKIAKK